MNGIQHAPVVLPTGGRTIVRSGDGDDRFFGDNTRSPLSIFGEGGRDMINSGQAAGFLHGGDGVDRIRGLAGDDQIRGGSERDFLFGMDGNDLMIGGTGNDTIEGNAGNDFLIGGADSDYAKGGAGDDLLIGSRTSYDTDTVALNAILAAWNNTETIAEKRQQLTDGIGNNIRLAWEATVFSDQMADTVCSGEGADLLFAGLGDALFGDDDDLFELF